MRNSRLLLLALCACLVAGAYSRELLANDKCPKGCAAGKCIQDKTTGKYRCTNCVGNLVVQRANGQCGCRAGRTWDNTAGTADLFGDRYQCKLCAKGSYCIGGTEQLASEVSCGSNLDTIARGAKSIWQCVEKPGFEYAVVDSGGVKFPQAAPCAVNTYNPGYQKKKCAACPAGFVSVAGSDSADDCKVPEGFFLRAPGEIAPCPQGEYKSGFGSDRKCSSCPTGTTTKFSASTKLSDCNSILPGYYATAIASGTSAATAAVCPQNFWCPGIAPATAAATAATATVDGSGLNLCDNSLWTEKDGATSVGDCRVPPGHYRDSGSLTECPAGTYREDWAAVATSCTPCATGVSAGYTSVDTLVVDSASGPVQVKGGPGSCVLKPGYGMYRKGNGFNVVACDENNYGADAEIYGLGVVPCRPCPTNMVTGTLTDEASAGVVNSDKTGFIKPEACLTQAGYGYDGVVSTQCAEGSYNEGSNRLQCQLCPWGTTTTTSNPTDEQNEDEDCVAAPGYFSNSGVITECPRGTYTAALAQTVCAACDVGKWTASIASDSATDCDAMCAAGYGGINCADQCADSNKYGPLERDGTACIACPAVTEFSHDQDPTSSYSSGPVARKPAVSLGDCVSEFAQIEAGLWYLAATDTTAKATGTTFDLCAGQCGADCMFFTFNYTSGATQPCLVKTAPTGDTHRIAFKAVPAGLVAGASVDAKTIASGLYTFWNSSSTAAAGIGTQADIKSSLPSPATSAACLAACEKDAQCTGVFMDAPAAEDVITECKTIKGDSVPSANTLVMRSMTHAVQANLK